MYICSVSECYKETGTFLSLLPHLKILQKWFNWVNGILVRIYKGNIAAADATDNDT